MSKICWPKCFQNDFRFRGKLDRYLLATSRDFRNTVWVCASFGFMLQRWVLVPRPTTTQVLLHPTSYLPVSKYLISLSCLFALTSNYGRAEKQPKLLHIMVALHDVFHVLHA